MKILHLMPYKPVPPQFGGALRIFNLTRQMVKSHEVTMAYPGYEGSEDEVREAFGGKLAGVVCLPRPWRRKYRRIGQFTSLWSRYSFFHNLGWSRTIARELQALADRVPFDIIQTEFVHMGAYDIDTGAARILDSHNVEFDLFRRQWENARSPLRRMHYYDEYRKIHREETETYRKQDLVLLTSERDANIVGDMAPDARTFVLPNGVDSEYFTPGDLPPEPDTLVFSGMMKYVPNYDGVRYFIGEILPAVVAKVPRVKLLVVGAEPPARLKAMQSGRVIFTDRVDDVRPWVRRGTVNIVPLRMGGGTRLKILESFSMNIPVVATPIGAEGIEAVHGESIMIAEQPAEFADAVVRLLGDAALRKRITANARELMRERYEWSVIGERLGEAYGVATGRGLMQGGNGAAGKRYAGERS